MTIFEANAFCQEVEALLAPATLAILKQRFKHAELSMMDFIALKVSGIPSSEEDPVDPMETLSFNPDQTAKIIRQILVLNLGDRDSTFPDCISKALMHLPMSSSDDEPSSDGNIVNFPS